MHRAQTQRKLQQQQATHAAPEQLASLQAELTQANQQIAQAQSAETQARLEAEGRQAAFLKAHPRLFVPALSADQARKALPADALFVAFAVGNEQTTLLLLPPGKAPQAYPIQTTPKQLTAQVNALRALVTTPASGQDEVVTAGRKLFALLFPPSARKTLLAAKRLLVSPDDVLWELPFAVLVVNDRSQPQWLGLSRPITYTPSLSVFAQVRATKPALAAHQTPSALVVGNCLFDRNANPTAHAPMPPAAQVASQSKPQTPQTPTPETRTERDYLSENGLPPPPLPATEDEARQIAALYNATPLLGEAATEAAVRARLAQADIVHLATHGLLRNEVPTASGVLLSIPSTPPAPGDTDNDGALQMWELINLKLRAEVAVLSACETGRGSKRTGEGLIGLTRALQIAGCRSVVTTQWRIEDRSSAALMVAFHQHLRSGLAKDAALRQAMQMVAEEASGRTEHPYYWAAFLLTGDPDPVRW